MKTFNCTWCGQLLFFENTQCEKCRHQLGFIPACLQLYPLEKIGDTTYKLVKSEDETNYAYCLNHQYNVCNWMLPAQEAPGYCAACELNKTIPDLSNIQYRDRWRAIEFAKHRLVYSLLQMKLPVYSKRQDAKTGLAFDFLSDDDENNKVMTGHDNGLITLNIAEADDIAREMARKQMDEPYRTLLGHFRHEIGHYYWDRLIDKSPNMESYREIFGDETEDYDEALKKHYQEGPPADWKLNYISTYASTHPWEDWAETWAHYMHIMDTLQTAQAFGLDVGKTVNDMNKNDNNASMFDPYQHADFGSIIKKWLPLTFAMNSINRSMGLADLYPFIIPAKVIDKLAFIHQVVAIRNQTISAE